MEIIAFNVLWIVVVGAAIAPFVPSHHWVFRGFDFPRPIFLVLNTLAIFWVMASFRNSSLILLLGPLLIALVLEVRRLSPYFFDWSQSVRYPTWDERRQGQPLDIMTFNVQVENCETDKFEEIVQQRKPDILALFEVNPTWKEWANQHKSLYPYQFHELQDNGYGVSFLTRWPITSQQVEYLVDSKVPYLKMQLRTPSGDTLHVFCIHPRPPRPQDGPSIQRDSELAKLASQIMDIKTPVVAMGDFNDVPWSRSMNLFLKASGLKDPRLGRGLLCSIPSRLPWVGYPIDHVFVSPHFRASKIEILQDALSDHRPLSGKFYLVETEPLDEFKPTNLSRSDKGTLEKFKEKAKQWNQPNKEVVYRPWSQEASRLKPESSHELAQS